MTKKCAVNAHAYRADQSAVTFIPIIKAAERLTSIVKRDEIPESESLLTAVDGYQVYQHAYDPNIFATRHEISPDLGPALEIMAENIVGYGWRLVPKAEIGRSVPEGIKLEVEVERRKLESTLSRFNMRSGLEDVLKRFIMDKEATGNGYLEVVRNLLGEIIGLNHVPATVMRIGKAKRNIAKEWTYFEPTFDKAAQVTGYVEKKAETSVMFNIFFAEQDTKRVFFKEFGDTRKYKAGTTEMIWRKVYRNDHKYGLPRWIGAWLDMEGVRKAAEVNFTTFANNCIPALAILVSGGKISDGTHQRIQEFLDEGVKESDNMASVLIVEAEISDEWFQTPPQVKVAMQPLKEAQHTDALFLDYTEKGSERIFQAFRVPKLFAGISGKLNRAVGDMLRILTDEQVFEPERRSLEYIFNGLLFPEMGVKYHTLKFNTPSITDNEALARIANMLERTGGMTPETAHSMAEQILNRELPMPEGIDPRRPYSYQVAEISQQSQEPPREDRREPRKVSNQDPKEDVRTDVDPNKVKKFKELMKDLNSSDVEVLRRIFGSIEE